MQLNKILIASNNQGKIKEITALLAQINIAAIAPKNLPEFENFTEPEETGATFEENSLIKAKFYAKTANLPALADDSGLCVHDLDNEPGIHSARFALNDQGQKDFPHAFQKILTKLPENSTKTAHFICNLTIFDPITNQSHSFEGRVDGKLCQPRGDKGFGYDPIFIKDGLDKTFGEIDPATKDQISHRADAFKKFLNWLKNAKD